MNLNVCACVHAHTRTCTHTLPHTSTQNYCRHTHIHWELTHTNTHGDAYNLYYTVYYNSILEFFSSCDINSSLCLWNTGVWLPIGPYAPCTTVWPSTLSFLLCSKTKLWFIFTDAKKTQFSCENKHVYYEVTKCMVTLFLFPEKLANTF